MIMTSMPLMTLVLCSAACFGQPSSQPANHEPATAFQRLAAARHARYVLEGVVVDEQGKPVDDVLLSISEGHPRKVGFDTDYTTRSRKINGAFAVEVADADSVELRFGREGFFGEAIGFGFSDGLPAEWKQRIAIGETLVPEVVKRAGLRIVMEKHGKLAVLTEVVDRITCPASGPGMVWDVTVTNYSPTREVADLRDVASLPENCIYLDVPLASADKLALDQVKLGKAEHACPKSLRIVLKGGGGFVPVATTEKTKAMQYRRMTEAPDKGYQNELVLNDEAIKQYFQSLDKDAHHGAFFYFKVGKLYGKGELSIGFPANAKATVGLVLRFQTDGSRNLATED